MVRKDTQLTVYILTHGSDEEDGGSGDFKICGIYSTRESAAEAIAKLILKPGFDKFPEDFVVDPYTLDEVCWGDGFTTYEY